MAADKHTEIEAKLRVEDHAPIAERLAELEAHYVGEVRQDDDYFDDTAHSMATSDRCLRLRRESRSGDNTLYVTYKGPRQAGAFKRRQELEFQVSDAESVRLLLAVLGYEPALVVEKTREVWELDRCQVGLDTLSTLGCFVEIEGPDEATIARVQTALGLADRTHVPESYACLVAARTGTGKQR
jgi:adenylate cyclase class 2